MRARAAEAVSAAESSGHPSARSRAAMRPSHWSKHRAAAARRRGLMMGDSSAVGAIGHPGQASPATGPSAMSRKRIDAECCVGRRRPMLRGGRQRRLGRTPPAQPRRVLPCPRESGGTATRWIRRSPPAAAPARWLSIPDHAAAAPSSAPVPPGCHGHGPPLDSTGANGLERLERSLQ